MKCLSKMALVGAFGIVAGAAAMGVLRAETAAAPAYLIVNIEEVKNDVAWRQYRNATPATEAAFGGRALVRAAKPIMIDSSPLPKGTWVVLQFPSVKSLKDWWNSPAYSALRPLRENSTVGRLFALEGVPAP